MMIRYRRWVVASGLLAVLSASQAKAGIVLNTFTNVPVGVGGAIGFAYAGNKFVGTTYDGGIYSVDTTGGNLQSFGPAGTITGSSVEHFIAGSAGYGTFAARDLYVSQNDANNNGGIMHITNDGSSANWFVQGLTGTVRGIAFDTIGTFNFDMLVTTTGGRIYQVNGAGVATQIALTGEDTEGLDIAPIGALGIYAGSLLVASEGSGWIRAIDPNTHAVTNLFQIGSAEELSIVPLNLGASGNPVEGFYGANYTPNVQKADASQFAGLQGDVIVTSESGHGIYSVHYNGSSFVTTLQGNFPNQPEDGLFVTAGQINNPVPEPATLMSSVVAIAAAAFTFLRRKSS